MKTLSIRQPWAWAIMHGGKDIENRDWPTKIRGTVLIHTGKKKDYAEFLSVKCFVEETGLDIHLPNYHEMPYGCIIGSVEVVDCVTESDSPWFFGKYGFVLKDPRPFPKPIPYPGRLGFFEYRGIKDGE